MCTRGAERTKALMKVPACISSLVSLGERAETSWPRQSRSGRRFQPTYECQDVWSEKELAVPCIEHIRIICFLHCDFYVSYRSYFWADCEKQKIRISNSECIIHPHGRTSCFFWKKMQLNFVVGMQRINARMRPANTLSFNVPVVQETVPRNIVESYKLQ